MPWANDCNTMLWAFPSCCHLSNEYGSIVNAYIYTRALSLQIHKYHTQILIYKDKYTTTIWAFNMGPLWMHIIYTSISMHLYLYTDIDTQTHTNMQLQFEQWIRVHRESVCSYMSIVSTNTEILIHKYTNTNIWLPFEQWIGVYCDCKHFFNRMVSLQLSKNSIFMA